MTVLLLFNTMTVAGALNRAAVHSQPASVHTSTSFQGVYNITLCFA